MPFITVKALVKDITDVVVKNFNTQPDTVTINFIEYSKENPAKAGQLFTER